MLYRLYKGLNRKVVVLGIDAFVMKKKGVKVSIGNAASEYSKILSVEEVNVKSLLKEVRSIDFWSDVPSIPLKRFLYSPTTNEMLTAKNLVMSEILVPLKVPKNI